MNAINAMRAARRALAVVALLSAGVLAAQAPPPAQPVPPVQAEARPASPAVADSLAQFDWLAGCWRGEFNRREFREHWMPVRGGMLVGMSQTVSAGKTLSHEYLRIERRADGIYYVLRSGPASESTLKLDKTSVDGAATIFTFANPALEFPRQLSYRRDPGEWLYATVTGKVNGTDRDLVYAMRRIDCETGDFINP